MRVVQAGEDEPLTHCDAAARGCRALRRVCPNRFARARIQSVDSGLIADVELACHHDRRCACTAWELANPDSPEAGHVAPVDLCQWSIARIVCSASGRWPIRLWRPGLPCQRLACQTK